MQILGSSKQQYWSTRERNLGLPVGKSIALDYINRLLLDASPGALMRVLDIGTGTGHVLETMLKNAQCRGLDIEAHGIDCDAELIEVAKERKLGAHFHHHDMVHPLVYDIGEFDLIFAINTFHEVFTTLLKSRNCSFSSAKRDLGDIFMDVSKHLRKGASFVLFDGIEVDTPDQRIRIVLKTPEARRDLEIFMRDFSGFQLGDIHCIDSDVVELSYRDFTRFITKMKWIHCSLWDVECRETYQYLSRSEMCKMFHDMSCSIASMAFYIADLKQWERSVEILSPEVEFPFEYAMYVGRKY